MDANGNVGGNCSEVIGQLIIGLIETGGSPTFTRTRLKIGNKKRTLNIDQVSLHTIFIPPDLRNTDQEVWFKGNTPACFKPIDLDDRVVGSM